MIGSLCLGGAAQAQPPSFLYTMYGVVTVQKNDGPVLDCDVAVTFDYVSGPIIIIKKVTNIVLTGSAGFCETFQFPDDPWEIDYDVGTYNFTIKDIFADTTITAGDCFGDLTAVWNGVNYDVNGVLPEVDPGTGVCVISGYLDL